MLPTVEVNGRFDEAQTATIGMAATSPQAHAVALKLQTADVPKYISPGWAASLMGELVEQTEQIVAAGDVALFVSQRFMGGE